jgi:multicomponent Na+:H+ antiporter subunit F
VNAFLVGLGVFIVLAIAAKLLRAVRGPTVFDRLLAVGAIGTDTVLLLLVIGAIYGRPDGYIDLAVTYAVLNFIGVVASAKYLDRGETGPGHGEVT